MTFIREFWEYLLLSAPYLMLGLLVAALIHEFITEKTIKKHLGGSGFLPIFKGALLGVPLPLCSCSVIPVAVELKKSGAKNGATSAFLISTPESGIDSVAVTYAMMDLPMTILRPLVAFISSLLAGILNYLFKTDISALVEEKKEKSCCHQEKEKTTKKQKERGTIQRILRYAYHDLLKDIALWLCFGLIVGHLINYFIPDDFFLQFSSFWTRIIVVFIGIPLYICASASTPLAASLILKGISPGTALLLLTLGPATNISNLAVLQKYMGKKSIIINIISIVIISLLGAYFLDLFYENYGPIQMKLDSKHLHEHNEFPLYTHLITGIFSFLLIRATFFELKKK